MSFDRVSFDEATANARVHYQQMHQGDHDAHDINEVYLNIMSDSILISDKVRVESPLGVETLADLGLHVLETSVRIYRACIDRVNLFLDGDFAEDRTPYDEARFQFLGSFKAWIEKLALVISALCVKVREDKADLGDLRCLSVSELNLLRNSMKEYQSAYLKTSAAFYFNGYSYCKEGSDYVVPTRFDVDVLEDCYRCPISKKVGQIWVAEDTSPPTQVPSTPGLMAEEDIIDVLGEHHSESSEESQEEEEEEDPEPPRKKARRGDTPKVAQAPGAPKKKRRSYMKKRLGGFPVERLHEQYEYLSADERLGYVKCLHAVSKCFDLLHGGGEARDLFKKTASEMSVTFFQ